MIRYSLLAMSFMLIAPTVYAEAPKTNGVYIGLSGGSAVFDDDINSGFYDDTDTAFQGYVGYKFFRHFGIEGRVANLGGYSDGFDTLDISSVSVHAVGFIPFGETGLELFGQAGFARVNEEISNFFDQDETAYTLGFGLRWHINQNFAIAGQIDAYAWENDFAGSDTIPSVGTNMLSVQLNF